MRSTPSQLRLRRRRRVCGGGAGVWGGCGVGCGGLGRVRGGLLGFGAGVGACAGRLPARVSGRNAVRAQKRVVLVFLSAHGVYAWSGWRGVRCGARRRGLRGAGMRGCGLRGVRGCGLRGVRGCGGLERVRVAGVARRVSVRVRGKNTVRAQKRVVLVFLRAHGVYAWSRWRGVRCGARFAAVVDGIRRTAECAPSGARACGRVRGRGQALSATSLATVFALRAVPVTPRRFSNQAACSFEPPIPSGYHTNTSRPSSNASSG